MGKQAKVIACGRAHTAATVAHGWVPDKEAPQCMACKNKFTQVRRRVRARAHAVVYDNRRVADDVRMSTRQALPTGAAPLPQVWRCLLP